ncbi:MAG: nuclear transport factor 2 family protein [Novosphingobium sp.]|nr:nuclear transport factor 2 family protein [Novosphingobium sp.]
MLIRLIAAFAALAAASCNGNIYSAQPMTKTVRPTVAEDVAAIKALEDRWSRAFLEKDVRFLEHIIAPEFEVHGWRGGRYSFTARDRWMEGARTWDFTEHPSEVLHVRVSGDTAVATVKGKLVANLNGQPLRNNEWVVTDTWLRRNGRWQVVFRYADTLPGTCKVGCGGKTE